MGYSTLPTDTMFILDVSGSMDSSSRDTRMVQAANKAIGDLLALNKYNRVGVVLYSEGSTLLMPLARYTTTTVNNETIPSYIYLNNNDYVTVSNGVTNANGGRPNSSREVVGGPGRPVDPYEPPHDPYEPTSPKTGDEGIGLWIAMLAVGIAGVAVTLCAMFSRRKRYRN